ncbi:hypothetical protein FRC08_006884 [Ceratobasidium sp. 394]|nr:hypothetical protein FRC08_006884 [Ceratobasidium sp. 394]KAG9100099.1 hypothetical protein FS749_016289 [Ceratobasidium sp. UAMH 11750]
MARLATSPWDIPELSEMIVEHCSPRDLRALACTSRANRETYNPIAWEHLEGIGNLFAVLDNSLRVNATGPGRPVVPIPPTETLDQERVKRFLTRAGWVARLTVNRNPCKWIEWTNLDRLLPLKALARDARIALLPWVTHFSLQIAGSGMELNLAPLIRLVATPVLRVLWVYPCSATVHHWCSIPDALALFSALSDAPRIPEKGLEVLSLFPETTAVSIPDQRPQLVQIFAPLARQLRLCTISEWLVTPAVITALAAAPLERLEIQGRFAVDGANLDGVSQLILPARAFTRLHTLVLSHIALEPVTQLLGTPHILECVEALRVEITPVDFSGPQDDQLYSQVLQRVLGAPALRTACFIAGQRDGESGHGLPPHLVTQLAEKQLDVLRLYHFRIDGVVGFGVFHAQGSAAWNNLTRIAMMHQNLTPEDLTAFSRFPNLSAISANISLVLGAKRQGESAAGFARHLQLSSQFFFGCEYTASNSDFQAIIRISCLLLDLCPNGLSLVVDREFEGLNDRDRRDWAWVDVILKALQQAGLVKDQNIVLY